MLPDIHLFIQHRYPEHLFPLRACFAEHFNPKSKGKTKAEIGKQIARSTAQDQKQDKIQWVEEVIQSEAWEGECRLKLSSHTVGSPRPAADGGV